MLAAVLCAGELSAVCSCDPDVAYTSKPEWTGPYASQTQVDVNLGNTPENFIAAAYWQIAGVAPPAAFVTDHANRLRTWGWWRRIDTVNTIRNSTGQAKARRYSDPWASQPAFDSVPCKTSARDVGAVLMMFFGCPGGSNCGMDWANNHSLGMNATHSLLGGGYYNPNNSNFFYRELRDARYAGLQFFLPNVYGWDITDGGVDNLRNALLAIEAEGLASPVKVGMMDDTWGWGNGGRPWPWNTAPNMADTVGASDFIFNNKWAPYFDRIPSQFWYTVAGKPMIYFYNAGTLGSSNSSNVIARLKTLFQARYGVLPFVAVDSFFFADGNMVNVADSRFTWKTVYNPGGQNIVNNMTRYAKNGVTMAHAMVRWDDVGRGNPNAVATAADELIKGPEYLIQALQNSINDQILVLATWNDLGEGTGINRATDYYHQGQWLAPNHFMNLIRASQSQQSCGTILPTPVPTLVQTPLVSDFETVNSVNALTEWNGGSILTARGGTGTTLVQNPWSYAAHSVTGNGGGKAGRISGTLARQTPPTVYPYAYLALELTPGGSVPTNANINVSPQSPNQGLQFDYKAGAAGVQYRVDLVQADGATTFAYTYFQFVFTAPDTAWHTYTVYFPGVSGGGFRFSRPGGGVFDPTVLGAVLFQVQPSNASTVAYDLSVDNVTFDVPPPPPAVAGPLITDFDSNNALANLTEWSNGNILTARDGFGTTLTQYPWTWSSGSAAGSGGSGGRISGNLVAQIPASSQYPYAFLGLELKPGGSIPTNADVNVVPYAPNQGLQFDYKAGVAGVQYRVDLVEKDGVTTFGYTYFQYVFTAPDTAWHTVDVYFPNVAGAANRFTRPGGGTFDPTNLGAVLFQVQPINGTAVAYDLSVDNVSFDVPAAPTPTPSPTASGTRTSTPTRTPSPSPTATRSASPSPSPSPTPSASPTATIPAPTSSPTRTASSSPTASPSASPTASASATPSATGSRSPSPTPSSSPSATRSSSATPSLTITLTATVSPPLSPTSTATASPVFSATSTSSVPSATASSSASATPTHTPSPTSSATPTPSFSRTASPTATPSASPSPSSTSSATVTPSPSRTLTASATPQLTATATPTRSPALTATATFSPTAQASATPPATALPSATPSSSPSPSFTITRSASPTATRTATRSATASRTATPTPTPTLTGSPAVLSATPTSSATSSLTPNPTQTLNRGQGRPKPRTVLAFPNPQSGPRLSFGVEMEGPADRLEIKIYGKSMVLLGSSSAGGSFAAGWNQVSFHSPADLVNGTYYVVMSGHTDSGEEGLAEAPAKLVILR